MHSVALGSAADLEYFQSAKRPERQDLQPVCWQGACGLVSSGSGLLAPPKPCTQKGLSSCSAALNFEPIGSLKHTRTALVFVHWGKSGGESVQAGLQDVAAAGRFNFAQLHEMYGHLRWNRTLNSNGTEAAEEGDPRYVATEGTIVSWVRRDEPAVSPPGVFWFPRSPLVTWVRDPVSRFISAWRAQARKEANTKVSLNAELSADATAWDTHLHAAADLAYYLLGAVPLRAPTNTSCRRSTSGPQSEACLIGVVSDEPTRGRVAWAELLPFKPVRAAAVAGHSANASTLAMAWAALAGQLFFVGRTEAMAEDWSRLLIKMDVPRHAWKPLHHSHHFESYGYAATPWTVAVLRKVYARLRLDPVDRARACIAAPGVSRQHHGRAQSLHNLDKKRGVMHGSRTRVCVLWSGRVSVE